MIKKIVLWSLLMICSFYAHSQLQFKQDTSLHNLGEVLVKALKTNTKITELPLSVTVLPSTEVENNEINHLNDMTAISPNFVMPDYGSKLTSPVYIRGIGSRINSPSVGLYVDNVPYFEKASFDFNFMDIERIEILRGPQGTLYGRNSMGGLINITTKSPLDYQGNFLKMSVGNYGRYQLGFSRYDKIKDNLAYSFGLHYNCFGGWSKNHFNNEWVGRVNSFGLNNKWVYQIHPYLSLENSLSFEYSYQNGYPYALYNDSLQEVQDVDYNKESSYERKLFNDALKLKYDAKKWELIEVLSFQYFDGKQIVDQDFTPMKIFDAEQSQHQKMVANELIFKSKNNAKYEWLLGTFAFYQNLNQELDVDIFPQKKNYLKENDKQVGGVALFHQSIFHITKGLSVIGGLRYDFETSKLKYHYQDNKHFTQDTVYPSLKDNVILPKIALNYEWENASTYISYTTGYKAGGFNASFEKPEHLTFKSEKSYNYEVGLKSYLFSRFLYFDLAVFYTQLKHQQIYRTVPSGRGAYLDNAGVSENKGIEMSLNTMTYKGFKALLSYGYTHSKILKYVKNDKLNYNHHFTPYIPRQTFAIQLNKKFSFFDSKYIDYIQTSVMYQVKGLQYWDLENRYKEKAYGLLNAKISAVRKNVSVEFWAKNILNQEYKAFLFSIPNLRNTYAQAGGGIQLGFNLSVHF